MNCRKVSHFLSAYMDGELPGVEHRQIHEHIGQCAACAQEYRSLLQMKRLLAGLQVREAAPDLPARLLEKVHAHNGPHPNAAPRRFPLVRLTLPANLAPRWRMSSPRFGYLAAAASLSVVGIVYASYAIDRSDQIQWHDSTPTEIASLPPALMPSSAPAQSGLPSVLSGQDPAWQPVGNTYYTSDPNALFSSPGVSPPSAPPVRRVWPASPFFYRR